MRLGSELDLRGAPTEFLAWWMDELAACVPVGIKRRFVPRPAIWLILEQASLRVLDARSRTPVEILVPWGSTSPPDDGTLDNVLRGLGSGTNVAIAISASRSFLRVRELPTMAPNRLRNVLALELAARTPFRSDMVFTGHHITGMHPDNDAMLVQHVIVRRDLVEAIAQPCRRRGLIVSGVWAMGGSGDVQGAIPLSEASEGRPAWTRPIVIACGLIGAMFAAIAVGMGIQLLKQQNALATLHAELEVVRKEGARLRTLQGADETSRVRQTEVLSAWRDKPSVVDALEEVTSRMPDTAWVQELRIADDRISLVGFAQSAAGLVSALSGSAHLRDPQLAAPIAVDAAMRSERFVLEAALRKSEGTVAAGRGPGR